MISKVPKYSSGRKISFGSYNGVECDIVDPWDVAKKMLKLYNDEALRHELGMKADRRATKLFDWVTIKRKWADLIKSMVVTEEQIPDEWKKLYEETKV